MIDEQTAANIEQEILAYIKKLEAEVAEGKIDKRRLDWLAEYGGAINTSWGLSGPPYDGVCVGWDGSDGTCNGEGETLRQAIDAAMEKYPLGEEQGDDD